MKSQSTVYPESIHISRAKKGVRDIWLRRDITEIQGEEGERLYEYEEVWFKLNDREDIDSYVQANFEQLFALQLQQEYIVRCRQIKEYLAEGTLTDEDIDYYIASGIVLNRSDIYEDGV